MILHRFMSEAEFERLLAGERLTNTTDFHGEQGRHTTSVGFCFFPEDPDEAIHWLRGIVTTDRCVTLDIPDELLTESTGEYRDPDKDEYTLDMGFFAAMTMPCPTMEKKEYRLKEYSLDVVKVLDATDKYAIPQIVLDPVADPSVLKFDISITEEDIQRVMRKLGLSDVPDMAKGDAPAEGDE